jgi:hypothetical protein
MPDELVDAVLDELVDAVPDELVDAVQDKLVDTLPLPKGDTLLKGFDFPKGQHEFCSSSEVQFLITLYYARSGAPFSPQSVQQQNFAA